MLADGVPDLDDRERARPSALPGSIRIIYPDLSNHVAVDRDIDRFN